MKDRAVISDKARGNPVVEGLKRLLYPARCVMCDKFLEDETYAICMQCQVLVRVNPVVYWRIPHVRQWIGLWQYSGEVRDALVRYKFMNRRSYCVTFARELAAHIARSGLRYDLIGWVPISWQRRISRGYDQVELIAYEMEKHLGCKPVKILRKIRHNRRQSRIRGLEARRKNVRGVYKAVNTELFKGKRVLLLEDIITTGSTVSEAARVIKEAGAKEVLAACIGVARPGTQ